MGQEHSLYDDSPTAQIIQPWISRHLPRLDPTALHHLVQLVSGLLEHQSVLIEEIARGSAFRANAESNATQVRRIIRDTRLSMERVFYPLVRSLLAELPSETLYVSMDESSHTDIVGLFQLALVSDATALPIGFLLYDPDEGWADEARHALQQIATLVPAGKQVVLLADRLHAGEPFLRCLEVLGWQYIIRAPDDTYVETARGWQQVQALKPRRYPLRRFSHVRVWKSSQVSANVVIYRYERAGFQAAIWYLLTNMPPEVERCYEYACRWWQECGFKILKSALFSWERSRVREWERITVLLIGVACATWSLWMVGRAHERRPTHKPTTTKPQPRRRRVVKEGLRVLDDVVKGRRKLVLDQLPPLRVLDYERTFTIRP